MKIRVCLFFSVFFLSTSQLYAGDLAPGAKVTLAAAKSLSSYANPFQERFDNICAPVFEKAIKLHGVERENYMISADKNIARTLTNGERVSCRGLKANLIGQRGRKAVVEKGKVKAVSFPFFEGQGRTTISYSSNRISHFLNGRKIEFSFDGKDLLNNRVFSVSIPEFSSIAFASTTKGKQGKGLMVTSQQKKVLDKVYWYVSEQEGMPNLFDFYRDLLMSPKSSSRQIMTLYEKSNSSQ